MTDVGFLFFMLVCFILLVFLIVFAYYTGTYFEIKTKETLVLKWGDVKCLLFSVVKNANDIVVNSDSIEILNANRKLVLYSDYVIVYKGYCFRDKRQVMPTFWCFLYYIILYKSVYKVLVKRKQEQEIKELLCASSEGVTIEEAKQVIFKKFRLNCNVTTTNNNVTDSTDLISGFIFLD